MHHKTKWTFLHKSLSSDLIGEYSMYMWSISTVGMSICLQQWRKYKVCINKYFSECGNRCKEKVRKNRYDKWLIAISIASYPFPSIASSYSLLQFSLYTRSEKEEYTVAFLDFDSLWRGHAMNDNAENRHFFGDLFSCLVLKSDYCKLCINNHDKNEVR